MRTQQEKRHRTRGSDVRSSCGERHAQSWVNGGREGRMGVRRKYNEKKKAVESGGEQVAVMTAGGMKDMDRVTKHEDGGGKSSMTMKTVTGEGLIGEERADALRVSWMKAIDDISGVFLANIAMLQLEEGKVDDLIRVRGPLGLVGSELMIDKGEDVERARRPGAWLTVVVTSQYSARRPKQRVGIATTSGWSRECS